MKNLPFNLCIAFLACFLMNFVSPAFSSPTPTPTATIIPTPTVTATTTVSATPTPQPPTVTTGEATVSYGEEGGCLDTLNGTVNANGLPTTVWFEYGETSGSYSSTTATQTVSGTSDTAISNEIDTCNNQTTYYYRLVAQNSAGKSYGNENSFSSCYIGFYIDCFGCSVSGYVTDATTGKGIKDATILINGVKQTVTDESGYYDYRSESYDYYNTCGELEVTALADGYTPLTKWGNAEECSCSTTVNFELQPVTSPSVSTGTATDIKSKSATLNGIVNANDASADVWFEYDTTSGSFSNTTSTQSLNGLNGTDTVSIDISGLSPDTTYYYRITAQNSVGTSYGSETSFTTNTPNPPTVITGSTTNVTSNSANLHGNVNANEFLTTVWFEYGKDSGSYSNTSSTTSVSDSDNLEVLVNISGLSANTTYFYRIAAQSNAGTSYGIERSFTTSVLPESSISGYVIDIKGRPLKSVKLILDGKKTFIPSTTFSDSNGFFAFYDLDTGKYIIKAFKKGYKRYKKTITLEEGEAKEIEIKIKKVDKRG